MDVKEEGARKKYVVINVENIKDSQELHKLLKSELEFPHFYGMSWDAFWDAITGLVQLPEVTIIKGYKILKQDLPQDAEILVNTLERYNNLFSLFRTKLILD